MTAANAAAPPAIRQRRRACPPARPPAPERLPERPRCREPVLGPARQPPCQHGVEPGRHVGSTLPCAGRRLREAPHDDFPDALARERRGAGQRLEQHAGQGIDVGAPVNRTFAARLLGAHVQGSAHRETGLGESYRLAVRILEGARDPEVGQERLAGGREHDVLGLEIAVDHALFMGVVQCVRNLGSQGRHLRGGKGAIALDPVSEGACGDERHRVPEPARRSAGVEEREDVRMLQRGRDVDLALEALQPHRRPELIVQHLERHRAVVSQVAGEPDRRGRAPAQRVLERVAVGQRRRKASCFVREHVGLDLPRYLPKAEPPWVPRRYRSSAASAAGWSAA